MYSGKGTSGLWRPRRLPKRSRRSRQAFLSGGQGSGLVIPWRASDCCPIAKGHTRLTPQAQTERSGSSQSTRALTQSSLRQRQSARRDAGTPARHPRGAVYHSLPARKGSEPDVTQGIVRLLVMRRSVCRSQHAEARQASRAGWKRVADSEHQNLRGDRGRGP